MITYCLKTQGYSYETGLPYTTEQWFDSFQTAVDYMNTYKLADAKIYDQYGQLVDIPDIN